jgi:hypothetical protein
MLFLAKPPFCLFYAGIDGNKFREKYDGTFYGKEGV